MYKPAFSTVCSWLSHSRCRGETQTRQVRMPVASLFDI